MTTDFLQVSAGSYVPIHQQLVTQISDRVASGLLRAGVEMPSVRDLAQALVVNPMTVSKAYGLLVADGVIERRRGARMVVSHKRAPSSASDRARLLEPSLVNAAERARDLQIDVASASSQFRSVMRAIVGEEPHL